jgi:hypothetical protein
MDFGIQGTCYRQHKNPRPWQHWNIRSLYCRALNMSVPVNCVAASLRCQSAENIETLTQISQLPHLPLSPMLRTELASYRLALSLSHTHTHTHTHTLLIWPSEATCLTGGNKWFIQPVWGEIDFHFRLLTFCTLHGRVTTAEHPLS